MVVHQGQEGMLIGTKYEQEYLQDDPLYESKLEICAFNWCSFNL